MGFCRSATLILRVGHRFVTRLSSGNAGVSIVVQGLVFKDTAPIMENGIENQIGNDIETGPI